MNTSLPLSRHAASSVSKSVWSYTVRRLSARNRCRLGKQDCWRQSNLQYFGLEVGTWNSCPLDALRGLTHLRTFFLQAFKVEPPLQLSWTRHCATLRDVSVVDRDRVWCHSSTPSGLPDVMYEPLESLSYDRQLLSYDELRRYREAQQTCEMQH